MVEGIVGAARNAVEAPPPLAARVGEAVKIQFISPDQSVAQPAAANDNFSKPAGLKDKVRDFALNKVGSMGEGRFKERLAGFAWSKMDKEKVWEKVSTMPDGRAKDWWANYAIKRYGEDIDSAQSRADTASARLSALGASDAAGMRQALQEQNTAVGTIGSLAQRRGEYAGILRNRFDARLGNSSDPLSLRGRANTLGASQASRRDQIENLTTELQKANLELTMFQQAQSALVAKRAYGNQEQAVLSAKLLADILQRIQESEGRLSIMTREHERGAAELQQLGQNNAKLQNQLDQWASVQENGKHGTSAMERLKPEAKTQVELARTAPPEIHKGAQTEIPKTNETTPSTSESSEKTGTLAKIVELLLEEVETMSKLREELRDKLKPLGVESLRETIPAATLINLWDAYADNPPQTERISKKEASAILEGDDKEQLTLEEFGVALARNTEMKHVKIVGGMEKVAKKMKEKMDVKKS